MLWIKWGLSSLIIHKIMMNMMKGECDECEVF